MTLPFTLPTFNTTCDIWHSGTPLTDPPDLSPDCQLYLNTRGLLDITPTVDTEWEPPVWLRVPIGTDLRRNDTVECPPGSGWVYHVRWTERVHLGFANEYFVGVIEQVSSGGGGGGGGGGDTWGLFGANEYGTSGGDVYGVP